MRTLIGGAVVLVYSVAVLPAQQQPAPPAPAHNTFVLAGCLEAGSTVAPAFKLTSAVPLGQAPPARNGELGAVSTSGEKATYALQPLTGLGQPGVAAEVLKTHVGRRVEVTVRPVEVLPAPAPTGTASAVEAAKPAEPPPERFSVTAIKRTGGTCS
jgi:hypothetical protein